MSNNIVLVTTLKGWILESTAALIYSQRVNIIKILIYMFF